MCFLLVGTYPQLVTLGFYLLQAIPQVFLVRVNQIAVIHIPRIQPDTELFFYHVVEAVG